MQSFFTGVQGVANTPADPAARQQLISSAQSLANKFRATDQYLTRPQRVGQRPDRGQRRPDQHLRQQDRQPQQADQP